jgi:hypothetical protein
LKSAAPLDALMSLSSWRITTSTEALRNAIEDGQATFGTDRVESAEASSPWNIVFVDGEIEFDATVRVLYSEKQ